MADLDKYLTEVAPVTVKRTNVPTGGQPELPYPTAEIIAPTAIPFGSLPPPPGDGQPTQMPKEVLNYDNAADATAVQNSVKNLPKSRQDSVNPGAWGLLPERVQHGTLRNILGALGDSLLVGSGNKAIYAPRMEREQAGLAMAGFNNNPEAAIERLAATGVPGAFDGALELQKNYQVQQSRQDALEQKREAQAATAQSRNDNVVARMVPYIGGLLQRARTPAEYATAYAQAEKIAQRIGPEYHASDFGAIDPQDWEPGTPVGQTSAQLTLSDDKAKARDVSVENNKRTTGTSAANNIRSTSTSAANNIRSTGTSSANNIRSNARMAAGGVKGSPAASKKMPVVTNGDVAYLKANPGKRAQFEKHFGAGSAKKYLGK